MNNVSLHTYNPAFIKFIENIALCNFNELTIYSKNKKGNHFDLLNINFKKNSKFILIGNFTKDDFSVILRSKPSLLLYIEENFNRDIFLNSKKEIMSLSLINTNDIASKSSRFIFSPFNLGSILTLLYKSLSCSACRSTFINFMKYKSSLSATVVSRKINSFSNNLIPDKRRNIL